MLIHKHLIKKYIREVRVLYQNVSHYDQVYADHRIHLMEFEEESHDFIAELERIHKHNSIEMNELNTIRRNIKFSADEERNDQYFQEAIIKINQLIATLINRIPAVLTNLKKLDDGISTKDKVDDKLKGELVAELKQIEDFLTKIVSYSEGLANTIKKQAVSFEQEIKWLEKESDMFKKIRHNINSWFL